MHEHHIPRVLTSEEQHRRMLQTPVAKLVLSLAAPTVASQLISIIYNTADTYFVSQISTSASAAVGVVFSALFESLGMGKESLVISLLRQFLITLPLAFLLSFPLGLTGIWISFPIAETAAALVSLLLFRRVRKRDDVLRGGNQ